MSKKQNKTTKGLSRREVIKSGLAAGGVALLVGQPIHIAAQFGGGRDSDTSPATTPFVDELPIPPVAQAVPSLSPAANPAAFQRYSEFLPQRLYAISVSEIFHSFHRDLPLSPVSGYSGTSPGPTFHSRYNQPALVRFRNDLPPDSVGFGLPSVITHLHNAHTASESDGFPGDFYEIGTYKDHHYPNIYAGGDVREALGTLFYHDHRLDFTAPNVYKGLSGFYLLFDERDSGDENDANPNALRLPSGAFDVPLMFADKRFEANGQLLFDNST